MFHTVVTTSRRSGPVIDLTAARQPPRHKRGIQQVLNLKTGKFEPEMPRFPKASPTALPTPIQDTKASHGQAAPKTRKARKARAEDQPVDLLQLKWLTVAQTSRRYPGFSEKAIRHLISQAEAYAKYPKAGLRSNGFISCIVRPAGARKILISTEVFEAWLRSYAASGGK